MYMNYILLILFLIGTYLYINLKRKNSQLLQELSLLKDNIKLEYETLFAAWCVSHEKEIRKDALDRSRSVMRGQATEHLAPHIVSDCSPKDYRFMGNPIDYVVFDGLSAITDGKEKNLKQIIFKEIKTGKSKLTKVERAIKRCIEEKNIVFQTINPDKEN